MIEYDIYFRGGYSVAIKANGINRAIAKAKKSAIERGYLTPAVFKIICGNGTTVFYCGVMEECAGEEHQNNNAIPKGVVELV